ncbi:MAG: GTP-binding protein [Chloroflexi bacterium]|nr:GTP-binding protein [Chloroflexota bacterium]
MFVVGTAGHVDHGKSTLVQSLTGIDPDRLQEEKDRGMTIDLGFAWLQLPGGNEVSIVDVPGHERFVNNMLAGVGGIDLALLVVAADESVMPQTREHVAILDLLQIPRGLVALTKTDLVEEDWIELVMADVEKALEGTTLEGSQIVPVSAMTGDGLPELIDAMEDNALVTRQAAAAAVGKIMGWQEGFNPEDSAEARAEAVEQFRERWLLFEGSDLYRVATDPEVRKRSGENAAKKAKFLRRKQRAIDSGKN